jgi:hypothetical protein
MQNFDPDNGFPLIWPRKFIVSRQSVTKFVKKTFTDVDDL